MRIHFRARIPLRWITCACLLTLAASGSFANQKKKVQEDATPPEQVSIPMPPVPLFDELDHDIGEMLGAWQVGDVEAMHKYYDDRATFVSGDYAPPIVGWQNYAAAYQQQRSHIQGMQFVRRNTFIFSKGDFAWATYQWEIAAIVDDRPSSDRGQTTLVFFHAGDRWLIVHNHTSDAGQPPQPASTTQQTQPQGTQHP